MTTGRINQVDTLPNPKLRGLPGRQRPSSSRLGKNFWVRNRALQAMPRSRWLADCIKHQAYITTQRTPRKLQREHKVLLKERCLKCTHKVPAPQHWHAVENQHQQQTHLLPQAWWIAIHSKHHPNKQPLRGAARLPAERCLEPQITWKLVWKGSL